MEGVDNLMGYLWSNFTDGFLDFGMSAYGSLEPWVYPLVFVGIIGYVYASTKSLTVAIAAIIFTFGIYGVTTNVFEAVPDINLFLYIISVIGILLLIVSFIFKRRN